MRINWKSYLLLISTAFLLAGCPISGRYHDESREHSEGRYESREHSEGRYGSRERSEGRYESHERREGHSENHGWVGDDDD